MTHQLNHAFVPKTYPLVMVLNVNLVTYRCIGTIWKSSANNVPKISTSTRYQENASFVLRPGHFWSIMFARVVLREQNTTQQITNAIVWNAWEVQFISTKLMTVTVQIAKSHFITADNVYPASHQTDGTLRQDRVCMAHQLYGLQLPLQDEIEQWF